MRRSSVKSVTPPAGFDYQPDLISKKEEDALLAAIDPLVFNEVRMRGVVAKRTVIHYGWDYRYDEWKIEPTEPIPLFWSRCEPAWRLA